MFFPSVSKALVSIVTAVIVMIPCGLESGISAETTNHLPAPSALSIEKTTSTHVEVSHSGPKYKPGSSTKDITATLPNILLGTTGPSALWLNEALSELNYLPLKFTPSGGAGFTPSSNANTSGNTNGTTTANDSGTSGSAQTGLGGTGQGSPASKSTQIPVSTQLAEGLQNGVLSPLAGTWTWSSVYPASLTSLWDPSTASVITQGAIMSFEHAHGLAVDGIAGPLVYAALGKALMNNQVNPSTYTYVTVAKTGSETLNVWRSGHVVYSTLANTGISESPTPNGTWPIYLRLKSQTMQGKTPSGATYSDPGVPWISYFYQGCAIHGYPRNTYGSPQSLGCVELPLGVAQNVYNLLDYGTLVTVGQ